MLTWALPRCSMISIVAVKSLRWVLPVRPGRRAGFGVSGMGMVPFVAVAVLSMLRPYTVISGISFFRDQMRSRRVPRYPSTRPAAPHSSRYIMIGIRLDSLMP